MDGRSHPKTRQEITVRGLMQYIGISVIFLTVFGIIILFFFILKERKKNQSRAVTVITHPSNIFGKTVDDAVKAQHDAVSRLKKETEKFNTFKNG